MVERREREEPEFCPECGHKIPLIRKGSRTYRCKEHGAFRKDAVTQSLVPFCECDECVVKEAQRSGYSGA